jgi:DNA repair protein RecO (recombination protein O)
MDWREDGVLLSVRRHGETAAIIEVFTRDHGRHAGVVRGGTSRKLAPVLQPGAQLDVSWRARLQEHIGSFTVEPLRGRAALIMSDRLALSGLNAMTALLGFALPERAAYPRLYDRTLSVLDMLGQSEAWPLAYLRWEQSLLDEMGFGLDLSRCAVSGQTDALTFVSPKSGRAVSAGSAGEWADKLLPLSPALLGEWDGDNQQIADGLVTTGYFLKHRLAAQLGDRPLPEARQRLVDLIGRQSAG